MIGHWDVQRSLMVVALTSCVCASYEWLYAAFSQPICVGVADEACGGAYKIHGMAYRYTGMAGSGYPPSVREP